MSEQIISKQSAFDLSVIEDGVGSFFILPFKHASQKGISLRIILLKPDTNRDIISI
jgi:hypothetical protein